MTEQRAPSNPGAPTHVTDTQDGRRKVIRADMVAADAARYTLARTTPTITAKNKKGKADVRVINKSDFDPETMVNLSAAAEEKARTEAAKQDAQQAKANALERAEQAKADLARAEADLKE